MIVATDPSGISNTEPEGRTMANTVRISVLTILALSVMVLFEAADVGAQGPRARPQSWADCELFNGVVTPATFKPSSGNFDELYMGGNGFKDGVPLISESKPGDQDYNGGRWHANMLKAGVDPDKYANACSVEDLDLNDFDSTSNYFECPLLPARGRN